MSLKVCTICQVSKDLEVDFYSSNKARCKDCVKLKARESALKNPEATKARVELWHKEHPERIKQIQDNWQAKNPGLSAERVAQWTIDNPGRKTEWMAANPEKVKMYRRAYRINRKFNMGTNKIDTKQWVEICEFYDNKCLECGKDEVTMDHVVPLSVGGLHLITNVQPLCARCNSRKRTKTIDHRNATQPYWKEVV